MKPLFPNLSNQPERVLLCRAIAAGIERKYGGCIPWPATQRAMVEDAIEGVILDMSYDLTRKALVNSTPVETSVLPRLESC